LGLYLVIGEIMTMRKKPEWLLKKVFFAQKKDVEMALKDIGIHTVCQEAMCPNMSECFSKKLATFMILGNTCTRACTFCSVNTGMPNGKIDLHEPQKVANATKSLNLKHVVITSVTRDDLTDGGAKQFISCVKEIKKIDKNITVELLIPDLKHNKDAIKSVAHSGAEVIGHNIETIPRLYEIRKGANYKKSLEVLKLLKEFNPKIKTKSALMLGLGESKEELKKSLQDLLDVGCTLLTMGQYLSPSKAHTEVIEYIEPKKFEEYGQMALKMGFEFVKSSPYTRSSYMAHEYFENGVINE
jgi:lipoic acid synthetase